MAHQISEHQSTGERPCYKVWTKSSHGFREFAVDSPEEGAKVINELAERDLQDPSITFNVFGLEEREADGEYHEWYGDDGEDVSDLADALLDTEEV